MATNTTNAVRQILMNELGLTRESVREEMCRIVKDTADSYLRGDQFQKALDRILTTAIDTRLKEGRYDRDMLKREVADGIQRAIMQRLDVSVTVKALTTNQRPKGEDEE